MTLYDKFVEAAINYLHKLRITKKKLLIIMMEIFIHL